MGKEIRTGVFGKFEGKMSISGIIPNYFKRYGEGKTERRMHENGLRSRRNDVQKNLGNKAVTAVEISEEGRNILREMVSRFELQSDYQNDSELTMQHTNEVAWEHYMAMRGLSSQTLKDRNYNVDDVMKSIMETYETRYQEIMKEHEKKDREVSYGLTGNRALTLKEDLEGLDEAFKMRLANLRGYITCQQTNQVFANPDSSWYFNRNGAQSERKMQDKDKYFDLQYQDTAVAIMGQAKEEFLTAYKSIGFKKGTAISILTDILNENTFFMANIL